MHQSVATPVPKGPPQVVPLRVALALLALLCPLVPAVVPAAEDTRRLEPAECAAGPVEVHAVARHVGGETLALDDGSEVRLAGVLLPQALDAATGISFWPPERDAAAALEALVVGRAVTFVASAGAPDRYGRRLVHAFVDSDGGVVWVQGRLLGEGHARAFVRGTGAGCAAALRSAERPAREASRGLWAEAVYGERAAWRTRELMRLRSTYQIVSGRVRAVAEIKGAVVLNFGADWRDDFTIGVRTTALIQGGAAFADAVRAATGRRVRVRGFIERRNGPFVDVSEPAEIELQPADAAN